MLTVNPEKGLLEILGDQPEWMGIKSLTYSKSDPLDVGELILTLGSKRRKDYWFPVHWWVYEKFVRLARHVSRLAGLRYLQRYIRANFGYRGQWPDNFYYKAFHIVRDPVTLRGSRAASGTWPVRPSQAFQKSMQTLKQQKPPTPAQKKKQAAVGKELMRRDAEYAKSRGRTPPKDRKEAFVPKSGNALREASLEYDPPIMAAQIAARVGLSIAQVGQALALFRSGQTIESVANTLQIPSTQAEWTKDLLNAYGGEVKLNEKIDRAIAALESNASLERVLAALGEDADAPPLPTEEPEVDPPSDGPPDVEETITAAAIVDDYKSQTGADDDYAMELITKFLDDQGLAEDFGHFLEEQPPPPEEEPDGDEMGDEPPEPQAEPDGDEPEEKKPPAFESYQPKTGKPCHCKPGVHRDNCPDCEGTGKQIDFKAIRDKNKPKKEALSKKDFEEIAVALHTSKATSETINAICEVMRRQNPRFNADVFKHWAANGPPRRKANFGKWGEWAARMNDPPATGVESLRRR